MHTSLAIPCLAALVFIGTVHGALAQVYVDVEHIEGNILATFTASDTSLNSIIVWFQPNGAAITGYATDPDWMVDGDNESIRIYGNMLDDGDTIKVGITIQGEMPSIYWSASQDSDEIQRGWLFTPEETNQTSEPATLVSGILSTSEFYTIPTKPAPGHAIRLVGSGFGHNQEMNVSIGGYDAGTVITGAAGTFVATKTIPDILRDRVDFILVDHADNTVGINIRLAEVAASSISMDGLHVDQLEESYQRGDRISMSGTSVPLRTLVIGVYGPDGKIISVDTVTSTYDGFWSTQEVIIPLDATLGEYTIMVEDGHDIVEMKLMLESGSVISLKPIRTVFQPGDVIVFNGTAIPNTDIHVILRDPGGAELALDSWTTSPDGLVSWEYSTDLTLRKGTYTLIASQGTQREFSYAGLGTIVERPTIISFDKANYISTDTPNIIIAGTPDDDVSILVLDDSDLVVHQGNATLQQDGKAAYHLDISGLSSGVYTAIVQSGTVQHNHKFGVGLSMGSTVEIVTNTDRNPGDTVRITGTTSGNVVLTISLTDPHGVTVQRVETLVDKTGMLNEQRLRIPIDAESGTWSVKATSGPNSDVMELIVNRNADSGLAVTVEDSQGKPTIVISGVSQEYVTVSISEGGVYVVEPQRAYVTSAGSGHLPWNIVIPGIYTITVEAGSESASYKYTYTR